MGDDVTKRITIQYNDNGSIKKMTEQTQQLNRETGKLVTTMNVDVGKGLTTVKQTTTDASKGMSTLGSVANSTMMRFIGLNAIIGYAQQGFQELKQWVNDSVESFRSFEKQMAEVSSILDNTTRDSLPSLEVGITNLSVKYGQAVGDLTKGLYEIVSAAFEVNDAMDLLNTVTKASIAGLTSVTTAAKTFTGVLNAYGLSASHAAEYSDMMFEAVIRGNFVFADLESSLGYVTPIAASAGIEFKEVAAALATATRQGQHIDSVTRGLGLLIQGIIDPTKEAADAAAKYGIDMSATALRANGLKGFLEQLSVATSKYGTQILPQLIGNMRSLRVALALASETGLKGFTEDMYLMETATGKTDAALTQMMNTQQQMADILSQSMEKVNRGIGEAWTGFDMWWKKAQLWWGTFFSGGNADEALQRFDSSIEAIRQSYIKNLIEPAKKGEPTIFEKLISGVSIGKALPMDTINKYLTLADKIESSNKKLTASAQAREALESLQYQTSKPTGDFWNTKKPSEMTVGDYQKRGMVDENTLNVVNTRLKELGMELITDKTLVSELANVMGKLNSANVEATGILENLISQESDLRPTIDGVVTAFEDMASSINESKITIISLQSEMVTLQENIQEMGDSLAIMQVEKPFAKFQEYASMAAKYGGQYIDELSGTFDAYGNSMADVINIIYEYNSALEEQKKETKEAEKASKDLQIQMAFNNIEMLKLQLIGMIRRRGNTRAEQRQMKQLEIENTKLRIEEMKRQYDAEVSNNDAVNSEKEEAYNEAQFIYQRYVDSEQFAIWKLKESRDDDIADLVSHIAQEKEALATRTINLENEYTKLKTMQTLYGSSLIAVANDPSLASAYKQLLGTTAIEDARNSYAEYLNFIKTNNVSGMDITSPTTTTPSPISKVKDFIRQIRGYADGTDYVPETGLYKLHQGEAVIPKGENGGSAGVTININNPVVQNPADISKLANALENVVRANLVDKQTGKSKYRM